MATPPGPVAAACDGAADVIDEDTFRILVATDSHVGYNEKDKVRNKDSLTSFEEVLQIAKAKNADFILHGGDLFHENKPSRSCLYRTMDLLRRYLLGPGDIPFEVVSDPSIFARGMVNYEDTNVNVEIPMFMIHGNHDDPGGESSLSAANLLEVASLVNYFGRSEDLEDIVIKPILLRKGRTQLAIYGLGNIRDERLHRAFQAKKVRFETPVNPEQWFNVMILHQNRHKGNRGGAPNKSCIHEQMLPPFLDLVIWGHEHDCEVNPRESLQAGFYVVQPGSSIATALSAGEVQMKHVALIDVKQGVFRCTPVPLWTVRPLVMKDVSLAESGLLRTDAQAIWNALSSDVEALIAQGEEEVRRRRRELAARGTQGQGLEAPSLPLVRLRVEHSGYETISGQSFGQQFAGRVANPEEVLLFHRRGAANSAAVGSRKAAVSDNLEIEEAPAGGDDGVKIQDIIYKYIEGEQGLSILPEPDLNDAVQSFVHRAENGAIDQFVRRIVEATNEAVLRESRAVGEEEIRVQIQDRAEQQRRQRLAGVAPEPVPGAPAAAAAPPGVEREAKRELGDDPFAGGGFGGFADAGPPSAAMGGGGARGGGRGSRAGSAIDLEAVPAPAPRGRGRGPGSRGGRGGRRGAAASGPSAAVKRLLPEEAAAAEFAATGAPALKAARQSPFAPPPAATPAPRAAFAASVASPLPQRGGTPAGSASAAAALAPTAVEAPTPFLRKRPDTAAAIWGEGTAAAGAGAGPSSQPAAAPPPTTGRRQWALRGAP